MSDGKSSAAQQRSIDQSIEDWVAAPKTPAEKVAAREHVRQRWPVRIHVIMTHDFDRQTHRIMDIFSVANRCDEAALDHVHYQLVQEMLEDIAILQAELRDRERWARAQLTKRPTPIRS